MLEAGTETMLSEDALVSWDGGREETENRHVDGKTLPGAMSQSYADRQAGSRGRIFHWQVERILKMDRQA